jgi:hypothetical protein
MAIGLAARATACSAPPEKTTMPGPVQTEQTKLFANLLNAVAVSVSTVGVFTPTAIIVYGIGEPPKNASFLSGLVCVFLAFSLLLHILAQRVLRNLEADDDE